MRVTISLLAYLFHLFRNLRAVCKYAVYNIVDHAARLIAISIGNQEEQKHNNARKTKENRYKATVGHIQTEKNLQIVSQKADKLILKV